jgi:hypothetical protein
MRSQTEIFTQSSLHSLQTEIFHLSFSTCTYKQKYSSWASACLQTWISTRCHIPEDCFLHSHRRENLKSYISYVLPFMFLQAGIFPLSLCTCADKHKYSKYTSIHELINRNIHTTSCTCSYKQKYSSWISTISLASTHISAHAYKTEKYHVNFCTCSYIHRDSICNSAHSYADKDYDSIWASTHALTNKYNPCRAIEIKRHIDYFTSIH